MAVSTFSCTLVKAPLHLTVLQATTLCQGPAHFHHSSSILNLPDAAALTRTTYSLGSSQILLDGPIPCLPGQQDFSVYEGTWRPVRCFYKFCRVSVQEQCWTLDEIKESWGLNLKRDFLEWRYLKNRSCLPFQETNHLSISAFTVSLSFYHSAQGLR